MSVQGSLLPCDVMCPGVPVDRSSQSYVLFIVTLYLVSEITSKVLLVRFVPSL